MPFSFIIDSLWLRSTISKTKQVLYLLFGGGVYQVANFLVAAVLARRFAKAEYATYRQVILICQMFIPIFSSALPNSLLFFLPRMNNEEDRRSLVIRTAALLFVLGLMTSLSLNLLSHVISRQFGNPSIIKGLLLGSLYPACFLASSFFVPLMIANGKAKKSAVYSSLASLIYLGTTLVSVLAFRTIEAQIAALSLSHAGFLFIAIWMAREYFRFPLRLRATSISLKKQLQYSLPLALGMIVSTWGLKIDKAFVSSFFDPVKFAVYANGAFDIPIVGLISTSIFSVIFPEASRLMGEGHKQRVLDLWKRTIEKTMLIIIPIVGIGTIISYSIIVGIFSQKYLESISIFQIFLVLIPLQAINWSFLLKTAGLTKYDFFGSVLFFMSEIALSLVLLKIWGIKGIAAGTVLANVLLALFYLEATVKEFGIKRREFIHFKELAPIILICTIPLLGIYLIRASLIIAPFWEQLVYLTAYILIYVSFLIIFRKGRFILEALNTMLRSLK